MMRVLVCGGRNYRNWRRVYDALDAIHAETPIEMLFHGNASGADRIAHNWAEHQAGIKAFPVPAEWSKHGKRAGPIRNQNMLGHLAPGKDIVVAFPGGPGTADMVKRARKAEFEVREIVDTDENGSIIAKATAESLL